MLFSGQILTLITARKRSWGKVCFYTCLSRGGRCIPACNGGVRPPRAEPPPPDTCTPSLGRQPSRTHARKRSCGKVCFYTCLSRGEMYPSMQWGCTPPPGQNPPRTHAHPPWADNPPGHTPANEVAGRYVFTLVCHGGRCIPACNGGVRPPGQNPPDTYTPSLGRQPPAFLFTIEIVSLKQLVSLTELNGNTPPPLPSKKTEYFAKSFQANV